MSPAFLRYIDVILKWEGGFSDDPQDPGGATKYGIAKTFYPYLDIPSITIEQANEIYWRDYWLRHHCDRVPPGLALAYFDCVVNQGGGRAKKLLQQALGTASDGVFGDKTFALLDVLSRAGREEIRRVLSEFCALRMVHYAGINTFEHFGKGWSRRLLDVATISSALLRDEVLEQL